MTVHVIGYEAGNLGSVVRAFSRVGVEARVVARPDQLTDASHVLLPGVGAFAAAMAVLERDGWVEAIRGHVARARPLLGICLGMQLLGSSGDEGGATEGLGLIRGRVMALADMGCGPRIPHLGWNDVHVVRDSTILAGIPEGTDFYFAHGYALVPDDLLHVVGRVEHGAEFVAVVESGSVSGIQCHPEKSSAAGLRVLANFAASSPC